MRFFQNTNGAVSIFLVIILVPMMTVSALFVDASKVKLATGMAESAGDLALNTALTNYDTDLKELYGLLATAQDTNDLFMRLEDYYRSSIISSGLNEADAELYVDQIMTQLGAVSESNDTSDIMNMELLDFTASKYTDADLANATILRKQIVDFMKYRAPINTGLSFVSSLKSFSTLSKQSELVEKKQEYYEAQQTVLEDLKKAWSHIAAYNGSPIVTDENYLTTIKPTLDGYADDYKDFGKRTIMSLYKKRDTVVNYQFYLVVGERIENKYDVKDGKLDETVETYTINYNNTPYYSYLSSYYKDNPYNFGSKKFPTDEEIKSVVKGFYEAKKRAENKNAPSYESYHYCIQFIAQKKSEIETYTSAEINFYKAYQKMMNAYLWLDGYDKVEIKDADGSVVTKSSILAQNLTIDSTTKTLAQWINEADNIYYRHMDNFKVNAKAYTDCSVDAIEEYGNQFQITPTKDISTAITEIHDKANGYVETLDTAIGHLEEAIKLLNSAKTKLTGNVASAKTNWSNVANDSAIKDTSLAQQDKAELDQVDKYLNETNINKLITRLENIKSDLNGVKEQVEGYKFADVFIGDIEGYSGDKGLENVVGDKWNDLNVLSIKTEEITNTATSRAASAWKSGDVKTDWTNDSGHQPNLLKDKLSMYTYLSSHFAGTEPAQSGKPSTNTNSEKEDPENGENLYNDIKGSAEGTADSASKGTDSGQAATETSKNNNISGDRLPSKISSVEGGSDTPSGSVNVKIDSEEKDGKKEKGAAGKSANVLNGLFSKEFLNAIANLGEDIRDKLFISDYILSMFSYDTIENEYNNKNDKSKGTEIPTGSIQTLTKHDINDTNNYAYGAEIEYILYGGTNSSNLTKAYGTIYGIRFGFNLVYAFATSEIRESALAIATPISAATLGVIPVPLIQAVIIIGIACCESAIDLAELREGKAVPLYKSSDTWHCSVSGLTKAAKDKITEATKEIVKDVAETVVSEGVKELNNVLDMADEELENLTGEQIDKIILATENAYDKLITENATAAIQQLTTLVNTAVESTLCLEGDETVEGKKAEMKAWIKTQLQSWADQNSGDDIASKVKREAVNIIIQSSDSCIDPLFDAVEDSLRNNVTKDEINNIINDATGTGALQKLGGKITECIDEIRKKITSSINSVGNEINRYKDEMVGKVRDSINQGAEKLKDTINNQIDGIFGTSADSGAISGTDNGTAMASLFSFRYSDYLRLFVLIGLFANEGKILLRTADVIQTNMVHKGHTGFELKKSAAYVQISATIQVKPTLLALPIFADVEKNPVDNSNWYTITYNGVAGY